MNDAHTSIVSQMEYDYHVTMRHPMKKSYFISFLLMLLAIE